ncbi:MAG: MliC family protein [Verrucomicrobia bacterium]|nr:MliC family protein [Verrucomicrobiota bacterium]
MKYLGAWRAMVLAAAGLWSAAAWLGAALANPSNNTKIQAVPPGKVTIDGNLEAAKPGQHAERYVQIKQHPAGPVVAVAEGDGEPRSVGSYSVRVYSHANPDFPTDDFIGGVVRARDGVVEDVVFADIDHDGSVEVVVVIRSVGTGSYLSADAFTFNGKQLHVTATASGLPKDADCVAVLRERVKASPLPASEDAARQLTRTTSPPLGVTLDPPTYWRSENGERFVARYGALSDGSLSFVKVTMPDGQEAMLPQALSASGARFTDERNVVWWEHQGTVHVDIRRENGEWDENRWELRPDPVGR